MGFLSAAAVDHTDSCILVHVQGPNSKIVAQLLGLSVKAQTRLLEDAAAAQQDGGQQQPQEQPTQTGQAQPSQQQRQQVATSILEPCDVRVTVREDEAVQDVSVDVSALQLRMSPDVMQLLLHLQQVRYAWGLVIARVACNTVQQGRALLCAGSASTMPT